VKKKVSTFKTHITGTGGGPPIKGPNLSQWEEDILQTMSPEITTGLENVPEAGIMYDEVYEVSLSLSLT
jgi:hypothetical protein